MMEWNIWRKIENMDPTGIDYLTMNIEVRIQMEFSNHFLKDSILNIMMPRFPILIQDIFEDWMTVDYYQVKECSILFSTTKSKNVAILFSTTKSKNVAILFCTTKSKNAQHCLATNLCWKCNWRLKKIAKIDEHSSTSCCCRKWSFIKDALNQPVEAKHKEKKSHMCPICDYSCATNANLWFHLYIKDWLENSYWCSSWRKDAT